MKPARFDYLRAEDLAEAHAALASEGGDASVVAGGQSLVHQVGHGQCEESLPTMTG